MTGYTSHTGSSKKFAPGWDHIFGGKKSAKKKAAKKKAARTKKKK